MNESMLQAVVHSRLDAVEQIVANDTKVNSANEAFYASLEAHCPDFEPKSEIIDGFSHSTAQHTEAAYRLGLQEGFKLYAELLGLQSPETSVEGSIGQAVKKYRSKRGYSLRDLASKTGLSFSFIGNIERGDMNPSRDTVIRLAVQLDAPITEFLNLAGFTGTKEKGGTYE